MRRWRTRRAARIPSCSSPARRDWAFLWRLAARIGFEVYAEGEKVHFRPVGGEQTPVDAGARPDPAVVPRARHGRAAGERGHRARLGPEGEAGDRRHGQRRAAGEHDRHRVQRREVGVPRQGQRPHRQRAGHVRQRRHGHREVGAGQDARLVAGRGRRGERRPQAACRRQGHHQGPRDAVLGRLRADVDDARRRRPSAGTTSASASAAARSARCSTSSRRPTTRRGPTAWSSAS